MARISCVAAWPAVRTALTDRQRAFAAECAAHLPLERPRVETVHVVVAIVGEQQATVLDERAVNIVAKFGDMVINRGVRRVAPDGKTMRIDVVAINRDGKETPFFLVFNKVR